MKIFYIECTEEELRANRGIMDAIVDACSGLLGGIYGSYTPNCEKSEEYEPDCDDEVTIEEEGEDE